MAARNADRRRGDVDAVLPRGPTSVARRVAPFLDRRGSLEGIGARDDAHRVNAAQEPRTYGEEAPAYARSAAASASYAGSVRNSTKSSPSATCSNRVRASS